MNKKSADNKNACKITQHAKSYLITTCLKTEMPH